MIYTLEPTNEGQPLNYVETVKGSKTFAKDRAKQIIVGLQRLLPKGDFGCTIEELNLYISPSLEEVYD